MHIDTYKSVAYKLYHKGDIDRAIKISKLKGFFIKEVLIDKLLENKLSKNEIEISIETISSLPDIERLNFIDEIIDCSSEYDIIHGCLKEILPHFREDLKRISDMA